MSRFGDIEPRQAPTYRVWLFIAGDLAAAKIALRRECFDEGLCVTVTPTTFVYTGGAEEGVEVGFVNYPRFPAQPESIFARADRVARRLMNDLCQRSALLIADDRTVWLNRPECGES